MKEQLTKREQIAAQLLAGIFSNSDICTRSTSLSTWVEDAIYLADKLIKQLDESDPDKDKPLAQPPVTRPHE